MSHSPRAEAMWKLSPDVVFRDLDGEAVILDLVSGTYFGLNEVGTRVWRLVDEGRDAAQIVDVACRRVRGRSRDDRPRRRASHRRPATRRLIVSCRRD